MVNTPSYNLTGLEPATRYMVRVSAYCGPNNFSTFNTINFYTVEDTTGIAEYLNQAITVYPNPTEGNVTIRNSQFTIHNVDVYNAFGQLLYSVSVNDRNVVIDMTDYSAGLYFARITTSEGIVTKRFVKK